MLRVTRQGRVFRQKKQCLFLVFRNNLDYQTKTIRLFALNLYEAIVNSGFSIVNYQIIENVKEWYLWFSQGSLRYFIARFDLEQKSFVLTYIICIVLDVIDKQRVVVIWYKWFGKL